MCGITTPLPNPTRLEAAWSEATVTIYGAERYVLGTKSVAAKLVADAGGGFRLVFRNQLSIPRAALTNTYPVVTVVDVVVSMPGVPGLSLAIMRSSEYPAVLRNEDALRIS